MSTTSLQISCRLAFADDAAAVARVHAESRRTTYQGILPAAVVANRDLRRYEEFWRGNIKGRRSIVLIAEDPQSNTVGFVSFGLPRDRGVTLDAEVYALYVLQSHQRQGIGRALLAETARRLVRQGLFSFYLWALKSNPARLFYETLGAEELTERDERIGDFAVKEVAYVWRDLSRFLTPRPGDPRSPE